MVSFKGGDVSLENISIMNFPKGASTGAICSTTTRSSDVNTVAGISNISKNYSATATNNIIANTSTTTTVFNCEALDRLTVDVDNMNLSSEADEKHSTLKFDNAIFEISDDGGMNFSTNN